MCQKYKKRDWKCVENSLQIVWSVEIHDLIEENALQIAPYNLCEQTDSLNNVYWKYGFQLKPSNLATFSAFSTYRLNCNCKFY